MSEQTPSSSPADEPSGPPTEQPPPAQAAPLPEAAPEPPAAPTEPAPTEPAPSEPAPSAEAPPAAAEPAAAPVPPPPPTWPQQGVPTPPPPGAPPAYPPQAYPAAGLPPAPETSSNAVIALILAIVSWAVCPIIPAIVALVLASSASKEIAASGGRKTGEGLVTAAKIVSWINIGVWGAAIVIGAFFFILAVVAGGFSSN